MKNIINKLFVLIIILINVFLLITFIVCKKEDFSSEENRYLTEFKLNNISEYVSDHFPFRNKLIALKNNFSKGIGKTKISNIYLGKDDYLLPEFSNIDNKKKDILIETINEFSKDKNVDLIFAPDSIAINEDKINMMIGSDEEKEIEYLYSKLNTNNINLIDNFKKINEREPLYYKTDHHWNSYGAYYAYKIYMESKNKDYLPIESFKKNKVSDEFLGTSSSVVYGLAKKENMYTFEYPSDLEVNYIIENKITNSLYNYDYLNKKDKYAMFLDNNHAYIKITNSLVDNNDSIIIIKNSYANSFVPFIVNNYHDVYVIDLRYYALSVSELIEENAIKDILILYNLNNLYSDLSIVKLK